MRIAYLLPAPGIPVQGPTGASAHVRGLCRAISRGNDLRVYAALDVDHRGSHGPELPACVTGVPGWPSWLKSFREMREIRAARRVESALLKDIDSGWMPDLIWERHTLFSDAGWRVSSRFGIPWALEVNSPPVLERMRYEKILQPKLAEQWQSEVLRAAPHVFAVSRWLQDWLVNQIGCVNARWLPNGTEDLVGEPARGFKLLGLEPTVKILGFVGAMKPWQLWQEIPGMAEKLGMKAVLIGSNQRVEGAICRKAHDPQQLADIVSAFSVAVAPYSATSPAWFCPLKIPLYQGQGVPVVASNIGDCAELLGTDGSLVPVGDLHSFMESIRHQQARQCPIKMRSWGKVWSEVLNALH